MKLHKKKHAKLTDESGQTQATSRIDHAFASTGQPSHKHADPDIKIDAVATPATPPAPKRYGIHRSKKFTKQFAVGFFVLIAALGGFFYFTNQDDETPAVITGGCSNVILQRAIAEFPPDRLEQLHEVVHEIQSISDHEQDPNCLYVLIHYSINASDASPAADYLSKLEKVYDPSKGYDQALVVAHAKSLEELRGDVDFLKVQATQQFGPDGAPL